MYLITFIDINHLQFHMRTAIFKVTVSAMFFITELHLTNDFAKSPLIYSLINELFKFHVTKSRRNNNQRLFIFKIYYKAYKIEYLIRSFLS